MAFSEVDYLNGGGGSGIDCEMGTVPAGETIQITIDRPAQVIVTADKVTAGGGITFWSPAHKINNAYTNCLVGMDNSATPYLVAVGGTNVRIQGISADYKTITLYSYPASQGTDYWIYY